MRSLHALTCLLVLAACSSADPGPVDTGTDASAANDGGTRDAPAGHDADAARADGGMDAGPEEDAGSDAAATPDASDAASALDAYASDAGLDAATTADAGHDGGAGCTSAMTPDDASGYYVDGTFSGTSTGARAAPFTTIAAATTRALADGRTRIYLAPATYAESVVLAPPSTATLSIEGGWSRTGTTWSRDCGAAAHDRTILAAPSLVAVRATNVDLTLATLTVYTQSGAFPGADHTGQSSIGVLASDASSDVVLADAIIRSGTGGNGGYASSSGGPVGAISCDGVVDCSDGANGTAGAAAMLPTGDLGVFDATGYAPIDGADGHDGTNGHDGTAGEPANHCTCDACFRGPGASCENGPLGTLRAGTCGCGGRGGPAGHAGRGGGASVAVLVVGIHSLTITASALTASRGGDASTPSVGSTGGTGTSGVRQDVDLSCGVDQGASTCVFTSCSFGPCCQPTMPTSCHGPLAGGMGGSGGDGTDGTGAPGGPSIALVVVSTPLVTIDASSTLMASTAGASTGGAASGRSAARLDE